MKGYLLTNDDDGVSLPGALNLGDAQVEHENITHAPVFLSGQIGLNDLSSSGTYSLSGNAVFQIKIQATGTPDNFEWRKGTTGAYSSPVAITGSAQLLQDGISITFAATTGHTLNDEWEINVGHEIHINEPVHIIGGLSVNSDVVVAGALRSLSPVRIMEGINILCDKITDTAEVDTSCQSMSLKINDVTRLALENDGTITASTTNYETLVTSDNDIPNRKFVMDNAGASAINDLSDAKYLNTSLYLGEGAGQSHTAIATNNVGVGRYALQLSINGGNTAVGDRAGGTTTGIEGLYLGNLSGYDDTNSRRMYLANGRDNGTKANTWIYGDNNYNVEIPNGLLSIKDVPANISNTGLITGGDISINIDNTKFDVAAGEGVIVNRTDPANPTMTKFSWSAQTALITPYLTTYAGTWIGINSSGVIQTSTVDFTAEQLRTLVRLGRLSHFGKTVITGTYYFPLFYYDELDWALRTMTFGTVLLDGNAISTNGANLNLNRSAGICQRIGANARVSIGGNLNNPHTPSTPIATQISFLRVYRNGGTASTIEGSFIDINPNQYDDGSGTLVSVGTNKYTILTVLFFPQGTINTTFLIYGQEEFNSFSAADAVAANYTPILHADLAGGVIISRIVIKQGITDLSAAITGGDAKLYGGNIWGVKTGGGAGGGGATVIWNRIGTNISPLNVGDNIGLGTTSPNETLSLAGTTATTFGISLESAGWSNAKHRFVVPVSGNGSILSWNWNGTAQDNAPYGSSVIGLNNDYVTIGAGSADPTERVRINSNGVGIGTTDPKSKLHVVGLPVYANNAAAITGGLIAGAFYRTGADPDPVCVVH